MILRKTVPLHPPLWSGVLQPNLIWCSHANWACIGVGWQSWGSFVPLPGDCIAATLVLESWLRLGSSLKKSNMQKGSCMSFPWEIPTLHNELAILVFCKRVLTGGANEIYKGQTCRISTSEATSMDILISYLNIKIISYSMTYYRIKNSLPHPALRCQPLSPTESQYWVWSSQSLHVQTLWCNYILVKEMWMLKNN